MNLRFHPKKINLTANNAGNEIDKRALPGRCHIRLRNKFACDVARPCARAVEGYGRIGMRTERQRRRPWQTGCRRLAAVDRPSLDGARPPYTRAHPLHPQRTSTSYFGPACGIVIRSQVT
ncbi:unnamed protein product [Arctia plantaginis]|uniref:Uncharacterized protein n=1 Tax=Arctia plantaginis TaxID=874455 RepID=A0A8S0ZXX2_ARCPL|nr:unnamed protein product [Arctia plantaginis]